MNAALYGHKLCLNEGLDSPSFSIGVVWSDPDLLEIELAVEFQDWSGRERAYVSRDELREFSSALDAVADGSSSASLDAGQADLGYGICRIFEYDRARHLGMDVRIGHAGGAVGNRPDYPREVRVAIPIERGHLGNFASELRRLVSAERGHASLPVALDWP